MPDLASDIGREEAEGVAAAKATARWLGTIVVFGLFLGFDNAAHLGGAASGALIAALWRRKLESSFGRNLRLGFVALLLLVTAARVSYVSVTNPFAPFTASERLTIARSLANRGQCDEAKAALAAALRIVPGVTEGDLTDPLAGCPR